MPSSITYHMGTRCGRPSGQGGHHEGVPLLQERLQFVRRSSVMSLRAIVRPFAVPTLPTLGRRRVPRQPGAGALPYNPAPPGARATQPAAEARKGAVFEGCHTSSPDPLPGGEKGANMADKVTVPAVRALRAGPGSR